MSEDNKVSVDFDELVRETLKAYCVKIGDEEYWMPKSQCNLYKDTKKIFAPEWLLNNKGLL